MRGGNTCHGLSSNKGGKGCFSKHQQAKKKKRIVKVWWGSNLRSSDARASTLPIELREQQNVTRCLPIKIYTLLFVVL